MRNTSQEPNMSARKLGRLAGLVFVLAVVFGGVGATAGADRSGAPTAAVQMSSLQIDWD
jgi:hypothetical protein